MGLLFKNNAETTLSSGINNSTTTVPVASAAVFPTPDANNVFFATIEEGNNIEVVKPPMKSNSQEKLVKNEPSFRKIESKVLQKVTESIVACGGGIVVKKENRDFMPI